MTAALFLACPAIAQEVQILATTSNEPPTPGATAAQLVPSGNLPLYLWAYGGQLDSPSGEECTQSASGDELCGIALTVRGSGGVVFNDFVGNPDFDGNAASRLPFTTHLDASGQILRTNNFDLGSPPAGVRYIGQLNVNTNNSSGDDSISVTGEAVGANLETRSIPLQTVAMAVPEPGFWLALGVGSLATAFRGRRSSRSRTRRQVAPCA